MTDYKIILCGESSVGKSSLVNRLYINKFNPENTSTIGAAFVAWKSDIKKNVVDDRYTLGIWDTAGQERFNSIVPLYIRNANAVLFCSDYNKAIDSDAILKNFNLSKEYGKNTLFYLVATKIDLSNDEKFYHQQLENFADDYGFDIHYTSSLNGYGVRSLFNQVTEKLSEHITLDSNSDISIRINESSSTKITKCCHIM